MREYVIKEDIVLAVCRSTGFPKFVVEEIVNSTLDNIVIALSNGEGVKFSGFGTFELKQRAAKIGRNPKTNEPVPIPARVVPSFKAGKYMKDAVKR